MDVDDGVGVCGRAREHALELGSAHAVYQRAPLRLDLLHDGRVALGLSQLEQLESIGELRAEPGDGPERLLEVRALAKQGLRLELIVPEIGGARQLVELV